MKIVSNKPTITRKELEMVLDCLINDELATGNPVKTFESSIGNLTEQKYALTANSLTSAYHLIFHSLQIEKMDEVIMPSYFTQAPLSALSIIGAQATLVDNEENSLFPSIDQIKEKINEKTKAIIIGHTFGFHFDFSELIETGIPIIEDISHAIGTEFNEKPIGQDGTITVASFAPSMIITTGNGSMVLTKNSKLYSKMRDMRGIYDNQLHLDYTITDLQGAMGISQLLKYKDFLKRRREIAKTYYNSLKITTHKCPLHYNENYAFQTFPLIFDVSIEKVEKYWRKNKIEVTNPIKYPLHTLMGLKGMDFPNCDRFSKKLFSLPIYPTLTKKDIEKISTTLSRFI